MIASLNTASAKIYQFTARKRDGASRTEGGAQVIALRPVAPAPKIAFCVGASYHDDAIAEEARARQA